MTVSAFQSHWWFIKNKSINKSIKNVIVNPRNGSKAWTPIQRGSTVNLDLMAIGDGSWMNPRMSTAQVLPNFQLTKEVSFLKVNGSPGLRFRRGGTINGCQ